MKTAICRNCGKDFPDSRPDRPRKYCSRKCAHQAQFKDLDKVCPTCGNTFRDPDHPEKKYCSVKCARAGYSASRTVAKQCPQCGRTFESLQGKKLVYCSAECSHAAQKGCKLNTRPHRQRPQNYIVIDCAVCGVPFRVHKVQNSGNRKRRFCSRKCMAQYMSNDKRGQNNPMYKDGYYVDDHGGRGTSWGKQRKAAFLRDGRRCQICGKKQHPNHKAVVDVHHIKAYRLFNGDHETANHLSNLITLCKRCHAKVEHGKIPCPRPLL